MTDNQQEDILEQSAAASIDPAEAERTASLQDIASLLWEANQSAPPLREDPTAAMLGLVPDPSYALDPGKLKQARNRAGLGISDLAARLAARGWTVSRADLFRWESQATGDAAPAMIKALAEETGASSDQLVTRQPRTLPPAVARVLESSLFSALVERWASIQNVSSGLAASQLESRMLATVYRGDDADAGQMVQSLEALVAATEDIQEPRRES